MSLEAITGQRTTPILVELKGHAQRIHGYESSVLRGCFKIGQELLAARELIRGNYATGEQDGMWLPLKNATEPLLAFNVISISQTTKGHRDDGTTVRGSR